MNYNNLASFGRFSSQMLSYLGAQNTTNASGNVIKYNTESVTFPSITSIPLDTINNSVPGAYSADTYNSIKAYFLSRNKNKVYADTMSALVIDMSYIMGVSAQQTLELFKDNKNESFITYAYNAFNALRGKGNQVDYVTTPSNKDSLQARSIRS